MSAAALECNSLHHHGSRCTARGGNGGRATHRDRKQIKSARVGPEITKRSEQPGAHSHRATARRKASPTSGARASAIADDSCLGYPRHQGVGLTALLACARCGGAHVLRRSSRAREGGQRCTSSRTSGQCTHWTHVHSLNSARHNEAEAACVPLGCGAACIMQHASAAPRPRADNETRDGQAQYLRAASRPDGQVRFSVAR